MRMLDKGRMMVALALNPLFEALQSIDFVGN